MGELFFQERGKGFPLILLHGFCETNHLWDSFATKLSSDFRVITPDLPGFGNSPLPEKSFSIANIASSLIHWLHQLNVEKCIVIGHSLGGYVTLEMIAEEPTLFSGFGLFHSTAFADTEEKRQNRNKVIEFVRKNGVHPFIDTFVPGLFCQKKHPAIEEVYKMASNTKKKTLIAYSLAMRDRPDNTPILKGYGGPCLLIAGKQDVIIPYTTIEQQSRLNQNIRLHILENSGHMGMFEEAAAAYKAVQNFVFVARQGVVRL